MDAGSRPHSRAPHGTAAQVHAQGPRKRGQRSARLALCRAPSACPKALSSPSERSSSGRVTVQTAGHHADGRPVTAQRPGHKHVAPVRFGSHGGHVPTGAEPVAEAAGRGGGPFRRGSWVGSPEGHVQDAGCVRPSRPCGRLTGSLRAVREPAHGRGAQPLPGDTQGASSSRKTDLWIFSQMAHRTGKIKVSEIEAFAAHPHAESGLKSWHRDLF